MSAWKQGIWTGIPTAAAKCVAIVAAACRPLSLQHEAKWTEQAIKFFNEAAAQTSSSQAAAGSLQQQPDHDGVLLFDLIFEKALDHREPACSRVHRYGL